MSTKERFLQLKEEIKTRRAEMIETSKKLFTEEASALFERHPCLNRFYWNQFTPYYADGDIPEFGANTEDVSIFFNDHPVEEEEEYDDDDDDGGFQPYGHTTRPDDSPYSKEQWSAGLAVYNFLQVFDNETLKDTFGDHAKIIVTKDGAVTEEYEHE